VLSTHWRWSGLSGWLGDNGGACVDITGVDDGIAGVSVPHAIALRSAVRRMRNERAVISEYTSTNAKLMDELAQTLFRVSKSL
jgi:hypothetical protein